MIDSPERPRRSPLRLRDYDCSRPGAYFVTICTHDKAWVFGSVVDGAMVPNEAARITQACWDGLPDHYPHVRLDAFVIMPNHIHGIIVLTDHSFLGAGFKPAPTTTKRHGLPEIVRALKTFSARGINHVRSPAGARVPQRNYYEHVIRDEAGLQRIRDYIHTNPARWALDRENPDRRGVDEFDR